LKEAKDMLILTRRPRQVVLVGREIEIMVLDITGDRVRLGITAPREVKVQRQEAKPDAASAAQP
jgi:carbon storage regulator